MRSMMVSLGGYLELLIFDGVNRSRHPTVTASQSPSQSQWRCRTLTSALTYHSTHSYANPEKGIPHILQDSRANISCSCVSTKCHSYVVTLFTRLGLSLISSPETTHNGHAHDIAKDLATNYDAVVTVSGDGLVHEVLNGFAEHADPLKAFTIPVVPIPTGSGNGLSLNLLGAQVGIHDLHYN